MPLSQLERYRVMRNVALSAMKKQSLTAVPTETVTDEVKHLKQLKAKALKHVREPSTDPAGACISALFLARAEETDKFLYSLAKPNRFPVAYIELTLPIHPPVRAICTAARQHDNVSREVR